jgi:phosphoserine phosphatase RsbU/P
VLATASYRAHETEMEPGDLLLVYTDGITEAADPTDEEFGLDRLADLAHGLRAAPLPQVRRTIEDALDEFVRGVPYADDRTLLFLRRQGA